MELRWYQKQALDAVYRHLGERPDNPCVVMPTGSGKSPLIAQIARDTSVRWHSRALVIAHRKELLQQNCEKLLVFTPDLDVGMYSAGLRRRDTANPVIFGGIQSIYNRAEQLGHFDLVLIDEAHLIPPDGEGMYRTFLAVARAINPNLRVVGFTATPYRMRSGLLCTPDGILNHICYETPLRPLINQGYLSNLVARSGEDEAIVESDGVSVRGGEFVSGELQQKALVRGKVAAACADIALRARKRHKVLIFCTGVDHARRVCEALVVNEKEIADYVTGETSNKERDRIVRAFREGQLKYLVNINCFVEGLDVPDIDCISLLRPTKSPGLYVQMIGRGLRVAAGKEDCLILDYGENVMRHGPIDMVTGRRRPPGEGGVAVQKICPDCKAIIHGGYDTCPYCGHVFPRETDTHGIHASEEDPTLKIEPQWYRVDRVLYGVHKKYGSDENHPLTVRVDYKCEFFSEFSEWICPEHHGYARRKTEKWWRRRQRPNQRAIPLPDNAEETSALLEDRQMLEPGKILVQRAVTESSFSEIVEYEFPLNTGELASDLECETSEEKEEDVPF